MFRAILQMIRNREQLVQVLLLAGLGFIFAYETYQLVLIAANLRPVADDYCLAGIANLGPIDYYIYWYGNFIADISTLTGNYLLIALPAVFLPYGIGTSVTFFACLIFLSAVIAKFLNVKTTSKRQKLLSLTIIFYFAYLSWITYWFVLGRGNSGDEISRGTVGDMVFFGSILNWQAANVNYVILPCIALLIYSKMFTKTFSSWNPLLVALLGFVIGGSFYVLSTVFILLIMLQIFFSYFKHADSTFRSFRNEMIVLVSALLSLGASYFSLGARTRRSYYLQEVSFSSIPKTAIDAIFTWFSTLYFPAILVTFLLGAVLYRIFAALGINQFELDVTKFVVTPFILSLLAFVVNKVSELFAYKAWWHELSSRTFLYIAALTFGVYCMQVLVTRFELEYSLLELAIGASAIFIALYSVKQSGDVITERKVRWENGPAQVTLNMDPFDRETAWVEKCWKQLEEKKNS
jgi:hypothetical protein